MRPTTYDNKFHSFISMDKFRFLKWEVYKDSQKLFSFILRLVEKLPREHRYELGSQAIRSAQSISLNIAEGSGKGSDKELNHYFNIALGSLYELTATLDSFRINNFMSEKEFKVTLRFVSSLSNQIGGFKKKLCRGNSSSVVSCKS